MQSLINFEEKKKNYLLIILSILHCLPFSSEHNLSPVLFHLSGDYFDSLKRQKLKRLFLLVTCHAKTVFR